MKELTSSEKRRLLKIYKLWLRDGIIDFSQAQDDIKLYEQRKKYKEYLELHSKNKDMYIPLVNLLRKSNNVLGQIFLLTGIVGGFVFQINYMFATIISILTLTYIVYIFFSGYKSFINCYLSSVLMINSIFIYSIVKILGANLISVFSSVLFILILIYSAFFFRKMVLFKRKKYLEETYPEAVIENFFD